MLRISLVGLALVASCSNDVDLTGVYEVSSAVGSAPCGTDEPVDFASFVKFTQMELFGQEYFAYDGCTDASASECTSIGGLFGGFFEPIDNGWLGRSSFSSGGGDDACLLGTTRQTALLDGTSLTIEINNHQDEVTGLSVEQCSPEEAEAREAEMPCVEHQRVQATRL